jgi:TniQ
MMRSEQTPDRKGEVFFQSRRLVARSSPEADESLYGWAVRLADANGYANARVILSLAMASAESSRDPLRDRLAYLVDGSPDHFGKNVPLRVNAKCLELGLGQLYFDSRPKICPACLADRAILKWTWNLRNWAYCPQHFCKLIQTCQFCHHPLRRGRHRVTHCGNRFCTGNLSTCSADPIPRDITNIVVMLGDVASGQRGRSFPDLPESFNNTSLRDLIHLIDTFSKPLLRDDIRLEDSALNRLKIAEEVLTAWPHGYHRYLGQLRSLPFDTSRKMNLLDREFHYLLKRLKYHGSLIMDAMKEELANYIEEHIPDIDISLQDLP